MTVLVNRSGSKGKSAENRRKFLNRVREHIKEAMPNILRSRRMKDLGTSSETIVIPTKNIREPAFVYGKRVNEDILIPGNKKFVVGDEIEKDRSGGSGGREGAPKDDGSMDDFTIEITQEEFLKYFFDDLELPDLVKKELVQNISEYKNKNAGWQTIGPPAKLSVIRTMRSALTRKNALGGAIKKEIEQLREEIEKIVELDPEIIKEMIARIELLEEKLKQIPFLDNIDLRYHATVKEPELITNATMFALADCSGSMGETEKTLARKFFFLLYMFLKSKYDKVNVVYIIHTAEAQRVTEEEFFTSTISGGTVVSTAVELTLKLIKSEFNPNKTNIYVCQCSDGDNYSSDNEKLVTLLEEQLLPITQYYSYIQINPDKSYDLSNNTEWSLWKYYKKITAKNFAMEQVTKSEDIYPVFRTLFSKRANMTK